MAHAEQGRRARAREQRGGVLGLTRRCGRCAPDGGVLAPRHLNATSLGDVARPELLITDAGCMRVPTGPVRVRRDALIGTLPKAAC